MTKSEAAYQSAKQREQASARACAAAYPAPWLFVNDHIELDLGGASGRTVRLIVYPPSPPKETWCVGIVVDPFGVVNGEMVETDQMPLENIGDWLARAYVAEPKDIDLAKIPEWAKAATAEALTPHRERIKQAQDVLRGKVA